MRQIDDTGSVDHRDLTESQLQKLAAEIGAAERVVMITGAGVSVASGIAPFRKSPDAIWERSLTERGTLRYFLEHPAEAWRWYDQRFSGLSDKEPNPTHYALAEIETWCQSQAIEFTLITQNVDRLHKKAGSKSLIEIHGRSDKVRCVRLACEFASPSGSLNRESLSFEHFKAAPSNENLPKCPSCQSIIRPHVLWFDETYDSHIDYEYERAVNVIESADLIIAVGTSFSVGITELALYSADLNGSITWCLDLAQDTEVFVDEWLTGRAEELTPRLVEHLKTQR